MMKRGLGLLSTLIALAMVVTMLFALGVSSSAAAGGYALQFEDVKAGAKADLTLDASLTEVNGVLTKTYDGKTAESFTAASLTNLTGFPDDATVANVTGTYDSADAGTRTLTVCVTLNKGGAFWKDVYQMIPVTIKPIELAWTTGGAATVAFDPDKTAYSGLAVTGYALNTAKVLSGESVAVSSVGTASVNADHAGEFNTTVTASLNNGNYTVAPLSVKVTVTPIVIDTINWESQYVYDAGDPAIDNLTVTGYAGTNAYTLVLDKTFVNTDATTNSSYYTLTAKLPDSVNMKFADTLVYTSSLQVRCASYAVSMKDVTYTKNAADTASVFELPVEGEIPAAVRALITYSNSVVSTGDAGTVIEVTATLPASNDYRFVDANGNAVTSLKATMTIENSRLVTDDNRVVVLGENGKGISASLKAIVTAPSFARSVLRGFPVHTELTLKLEGAAADEKFTVLLPVSASLYQKNCMALTDNDLYVLDGASNKLVKASEKYSVALKDGYYEITGYGEAAAVSFVIAPEYHAPFWTTAPGIALIILLVLIVIALLILIGLKRIAIRNAVEAEENEALVVNEPETEEPEPVVIEDQTDADESISENIDEISEELTEEVAAEEAEESTEGVEEGTDEAVAEAVADLVAEAEAIEDEEPEEEPAEEPEEEEAPADALAEAVAAALEEEPAPEEEDTTAEEMADEVADRLEGEVEPAEEEEPTDDTAVENAVDEAMDEAKSFNESADSADAVIIAVEEQPAEEQPAEEPAEEPASDAVEAFADTTNEENGFAFDGGLTYIDAIADPEGYQALLAREAAGEISIVTKYRKGYQCRIIQSQGNVQDYYSTIKNLLLSFKGVKDRISWNFETFNRGRTKVAKINIKGKTLYLYLAMDPEALKGTKYGIVDVSGKKKFAATPVLMKIRGERKFKYALELIAALYGEQLALKKLNKDETDYHMPYMTLDEMAEAGYAKKMVAAAPVNGAEAAEDLPADEELDEDVETMADADDAAEEEAAEEAPAEETTEEANADATEEATEEAPTEEATEEAPAEEATEEATEEANADATEEAPTEDATEEAPAEEATEEATEEAPAEEATEEATEEAPAEEATEENTDEQ